VRIAFFFDDDPRIARLRSELEARHHRVVLVGPQASSRFLRGLFDDERPDVIHGLGRGPTALWSAVRFARRLRPLGTRWVSDVRGVPFVDGVVDASLPGPFLEAAYRSVLGLAPSQH
jgi:hypothetical protein